MKALSDIEPKQIVYLGKLAGFRIAYNIVLDEELNKYRYDFVDVANTLRATIICAIIADNYSFDKEIAIINNKELSEKGIAEYEIYQQHRAFAKQIANEIEAAKVAELEAIRSKLLLNRKPHESTPTE